MTKTALIRLQDEIDAVRREAFTEGYAAAMQSVREFASRPPPAASALSGSPEIEADPAMDHRRLKDRRPRRGTNAQLIESVLQSIAPRAARPTEIRNALRRSAGWRWPSPRSGMRSGNWKPATWPNKSPTAKPGAISATMAGSTATSAEQPRAFVGDGSLAFTEPREDASAPQNARPGKSARHVLWRGGASGLRARPRLRPRPSSLAIVERCSWNKPVRSMDDRSGSLATVANILGDAQCWCLVPRWPRRR